MYRLNSIKYKEYIVDFKLIGITALKNKFYLSKGFDAQLRKNQFNKYNWEIMSEMVDSDWYKRELHWSRKLKEEQLKALYAAIKNSFDISMSKLSLEIGNHKLVLSNMFGKSKNMNRRQAYSLVKKLNNYKRKNKCYTQK